MMQSRPMLLIEALTNVALGYVLAVATQIVVFPIFGLAAALGQNPIIDLVFLGISMARGYLLRRLFERLGRHPPATHTGRHETSRGS